MRGDLPPFYGFTSTVTDHDKGLVYIYGGWNPGFETPYADFYRCDFEKMSWEKLTVRGNRFLKTHIILDSDSGQNVPTEVTERSFLSPRSQSSPCPP